MKSNQISGAAQGHRRRPAGAVSARGRGQGGRVTGDEPAGSGKERGGAGRRAAGEGDRGRVRGRRGEPEPSRGGARGAGRRRAEAEAEPQSAQAGAGAAGAGTRESRARTRAPGRVGLWMWPGWWWSRVESSRVGTGCWVWCCVGLPALGAPPPPYYIDFSLGGAFSPQPSGGGCKWAIQ